MVSRLSGLGAWLLQRLSAVYLLFFLVFFAVGWSVAPATGHEALVAVLGQPLVALVAALSMASVLVHAWVGMRDVILDYVHPVALRLAVLVLLATWLIVLGLWAAWLLLEVTRT